MVAIGMKQLILDNVALTGKILELVHATIPELSFMDLPDLFHEQGKYAFIVVV